MRKFDRTSQTHPESVLFLEEVSDEEAIVVHLDPVPARVGDHHGGDAPDDGVVVGRHVDGEQLVEGGGGVVGVDAAGGATVADVVLGARRHVPRPGDERRGRPPGSRPGTPRRRRSCAARAPGAR